MSILDSEVFFVLFCFYTNISKLEAGACLIHVDLFLSCYTSLKQKKNYQWFQKITIKSWF